LGVFDGKGVGGVIEAEFVTCKNLCAKQTLFANRYNVEFALSAVPKDGQSIDFQFNLGTVGKSRTLFASACQTKSKTFGKRQSERAGVAGINGELGEGLNARAFDEQR